MDTSTHGYIYTNCGVSWIYLHMDTSTLKCRVCSNFHSHYEQIQSVKRLKWAYYHLAYMLGQQKCANHSNYYHCICLLFPKKCRKYRSSNYSTCNLHTKVNTKKSLIKSIQKIWHFFKVQKWTEMKVLRTNKNFVFLKQ